MIDKHGPSYGWGVCIKEGPNREVIFWIIMATIFGSVVLSITWSVLRRDVQGGSSLGSLELMLPSVVMTTFIFRFTNHE
jgi:F0F1-type ATP synthase assembly protein I